MEIQVKPTGTKGMPEMNGQEAEKAKITKIQEMANQISAMCDSMMQREEEEDQEEGGEMANEPSMAEKLKERLAR